MYIYIYIYIPSVRHVLYYHKRGKSVLPNQAFEPSQLIFSYCFFKTLNMYIYRDEEERKTRHFFYFWRIQSNSFHSIYLYNVYPTKPSSLHPSIHPSTCIQQYVR